MPRSCLPTLVLIAQAVFLFLECGQTDKQTEATERPTPRRWLYTAGAGNNNKGSESAEISDLVELH